MPENHNQKRSKKSKITLDTLVGLCAIITSICAIIITLYQTKLQRTQQYASVKPMLMSFSNSFSNNNSSTSLSYQYELLISNQGLGPAIITDYNYYYQSKPYKNIAQIIKKIKTDNKLDSTKVITLSSLWINQIIPVGEKLSIVKIDDNILGPILDEADINIMVRYKSLYGQQWEFVSNKKLEPIEIN